MSTNVVSGYVQMVYWRFGAAAASSLKEIKFKTVINKKNLSFMLCANLIHSDPVTNTLILTHIDNKSEDSS